MNQAKKAPRLYNGALFPIAGNYTIDPVHSFVDFIAQHLVYVRGSLPLTGNIKIADDPVVSFEISIDTVISTSHENGED